VSAVQPYKPALGDWVLPTTHVGDWHGQLGQVVAERYLVSTGPMPHYAVHVPALGRAFHDTPRELPMCTVSWLPGWEGGPVVWRWPDELRLATPAEIQAHQLGELVEGGL
jgi:hypothetical protein